MKDINKSCVDSGSKYCPCHLAYSGDCIRCSLVRGEKTCDCFWQGVCVFNEIQQNKDSSINERKEHLCTVNEIKELQQNIFLIKIQVTKDLIQDLTSPGAYILLKSKDKYSNIFNTPISVMDVDIENNILEVVVKSVGIKTKLLINAKKVLIKGPYFNGVFGARHINHIEKSNCLVILNGLSQVNSINIIKKLVDRNNHVEVFFNDESIILEDVSDKIKKLGVNIHTIDIKKDKNFIIDYLKRNNVNFVYTAGANKFNKSIMEIVDEVNSDIHFVISNNNLICCGEGICGACTVNLDGIKVKSCKTQIDSRSFLKTI